MSGITMDLRIDIASSEDDSQSNANDSELLPDQCIFCHRILRLGTTRHHLIPRHCHRKRWFKHRFTRDQMNRTVPACRQCHRAIHRIVPDEKILGKEFNTVNKLLAIPEFERFLAWVRKQK